MRLQLVFEGIMIRVRRCRSGDDIVQLWEHLFPGWVHNLTGLSYEELRQLGEGIHEL